MCTWLLHFQLILVVQPSRHGETTGHIAYKWQHHK